MKLTLILLQACLLLVIMENSCEATTTTTEPPRRGRTTTVITTTRKGRRTTTPTTTESPLPFVCPPVLLDRFPDTDDCSSYYLCVLGFAFNWQCPDGSLFNPDIHSCDDEDNAPDYC